jgi:hypothetical protein
MPPINETPAANSTRTGAHVNNTKTAPHPNSPGPAKTQAPSRRRDHLRLVPAPRQRGPAGDPPAPIPTLAVTLSVSTGRYPYGRSRQFYLTPNQLNELLGHASRLEARTR